MKDFSIGDAVWCVKKNIYDVTSYHVPCIIRYINDRFGVLVVVPAKYLGTDNEQNFTVDGAFFEKIGVDLI